MFKNVNLGADHYPGIVGFPGKPGLTEAAIYQDPGPLAEYLPICYHANVVDPGVHYHYYFEDLTVLYRKGYVPVDDLIGFDQASAVGQALRHWLDTHPLAPVIRYDGEFAVELLTFCHASFSRFQERTGDEGLADLLNQWDEISEAYLGNTPLAARDAIHGDYRRGNVFHNRSNPERLRILDWEFAGIGWIHNDLASILKLVDESPANDAVERFAALHQDRSSTEHHRIYQRCRLERGLLDAGLVASQRLAKDLNPRISATHAQRVQAAVHALGRIAG